MTYLEAEYQDGYIHSERSLRDISPYVAGKNIFNDILEKRPEADHGKLVRFSLIHDNHKYSVDWTALSDTARPIRYMNKRLERNVATGEETYYTDEIGFGYQYIDANGQNQQELVNL